MIPTYRLFDEKKALQKALNDQLCKHSSVFILVDSNTAEHCLPELLRLCESLSGAEVLEIEPGEASKCMEVAMHLIEHLMEQKADRHSLILCLGGGVVTDLGAFVASIYKRGVNVLHLPTTLLGMIDAAIGGKTGIDHLQVKNVIGTFHPPLAVFVYPDFLESLSPIEIESAGFEMLKHGLVADADHARALVQLSKWTASSLKPYIEASAAIKLHIVAADPTEKGIRVHLNFGHTIGHALESLFLEADHPIPHGFAVGLGMMAELTMHVQMQLLKESDVQHYLDFLRKKLSKYLKVDMDRERLFNFLQSDKKNAHHQIRMVRLDAIGKANATVAVTQDQIFDALDTAGFSING